jgi:limonene-1,2-epoxide hydrolase
MSLNPSIQEVALHKIIDFFETISPETVRQLHQIYSPHAWFKDPFNEVQGLNKIEAIFTHMYVGLDQPTFKILHRQVQGQEVFLTWDFIFTFKNFSQGIEQVVHGASHLTLDENGLIIRHRDYWDAAEEMYEKIPYLGGFMRFIKRKVSS